MQQENNTKVFFATTLRSLMDERNVTQTVLAQSCGVAQSAVTKWLNGTIPGGDVLLNIARFFGVEMEALLCADRHSSGSKPNDEWKKRAVEAERKLEIARRTISDLAGKL